MSSDNKNWSANYKDFYLGETMDFSKDIPFEDFVTNIRNFVQKENIENVKIYLDKWTKIYPNDYEHRATFRIYGDKKEK